MTNLDKQLTEALEKEYRDILNNPHDIGIVENISATFKGKRRNLVVATWFFLFFLVAMMGVAAYKFFHTDIVREQFLWAALFMMSFIGQGLIKMWYWMEMNRVALSHDINRVELKLGLLYQRLDKK